WTEAIAPEINGARRWLRLGVTVQPSEITKVVIVLWTAAVAVRKTEHFRSLTRGLGPFLVVWGGVVLLVLQEPALSTGLVIALLGALVAFTAGARVSHYLMLGLLAAPLAWTQLFSGFRAARVASFLDP